MSSGEDNDPERRVLEEALLEDRRLGSTREEREQWLADVKRFVPWLEYVSVPVTVWALLWPRPYELVLAVLLVLPVAAMVVIAVTRGIVRLDPRGGPWLDVDYALAMPAIALSYVSLSHAQLVDGNAAYISSLGGILPCIALLAWIEPSARGRLFKLAWMGAVVGAAYTLGVTTVLNQRLDAKPGTRFVVEVRAKDSSRMSRPPHWESHSLTLAPWGPFEKEEDVAVPDALFARTNVGDAVCVYLKDGFFGWQWFRVAAC